jgi:hypothetical protein
MLEDSIFIESGLRFQFPKDWIVFKYDEHRFYRYVSGAGLKGVDFIGIQGDELYLMEVKNYADRVDLDTYDPMENLLNTAKKQGGRYLRKLEDSLRLLDVIQKYYHRKWWYRKIYLRFFRKSVIKSELDFWTKATELKDQAERITFILWLELPRSSNDQRAEGIREYFKRILEEKLPAGIRLVIAYSEKPFDGILVK